MIPTETMTALKLTRPEKQVGSTSLTSPAGTFMPAHRLRDNVPSESPGSRLGSKNMRVFRNEGHAASSETRSE